MDTPNVNSINIDIHRRAGKKDYVVASSIRPLRGGTHNAISHILEPKLRALIELLSLDVPDPPVPADVQKKN